MLAARPFARAAVRYRVLAVAFGLAVAAGPLAFVAGLMRPAAAGRDDGPSLVTGAAPLLVAGLGAACLVACVLLFDLAADVVRLRRMKRDAVPLGALAVPRARAVRRARVGMSPLVTTPTAIGYVHPAVVVPAGFRERVDASEWEAILTHECAHLARLDDWAKAIQSAVLRAAWWQPGLWILGRALDLERELASDEHAVRTTGRRRYAACLLRLATVHGTDAVAPALWGRRSQVAIRVERLLQPDARGGPLTRAIALGAFTACAFAVVGAALVAVPGTRPASAPALAAFAGGPVAVVPAVIGPAAARAGAASDDGNLAGANAAAPRAAGPALAMAPARAQQPAHGAAARHVAAQRRKPARVAASTTTASSSGASAEVIRSGQPAPANRTSQSGVARRPAGRSGSTVGPVAGAPAARRSTVTAAGAATLAAVAPRSRCASCTGPVRSIDTPPSATWPAAGSGAAGLPGGAMSVADDGSGGPVDLSNGMISLRLQPRVVTSP